VKRISDNVFGVRRAAKPDLSAEGEEQFRRYGVYLRDGQDLASDTVRNYLSDLRQFAAFCEGSWVEGEEAGEAFSPANVTTPTITLYRSHLKNALELKPASINRHLISIKRYFGWATDEGLVSRDPSKVVKLVPRVVPPPRHLSDKEEAALVAAVERYGTPRDRTLIVLALHTGLRAEELCDLGPSNVKVAKRSGRLEVWGKRGKYREVPLNSTAREALSEWMVTLPEETPCLFPSRKGEKNGDGERRLRPITDRALGYVVSKYAALAKVEDVSPQDLRHRFGYVMAERVPLHRLAQIMGHDSLDTTMVYVRGTQGDLQRAVEERAWA
jgi:integrase/recombinase XerC